jgi:hypothetical protein
MVHVTFYGGVNEIGGSIQQASIFNNSKIMRSKTMINAKLNLPVSII